MKKFASSAFAALVVLACFGPLEAFATNGSYFIGTTPASQAMGGTGVAYYTSDGNAIYKNPALLTLGDHSGKGEAELSLNYLNLSVNGQASGPATTSSATPPLAPNFSGSYRLSPEWALGLGFFTLGGAVSNFNGNASLFQIQTNYQVTRVMPALSYAPTKNLAFGISPFLTWGKFAINYADPSTQGAGPQSTRGADSELGTGYQIGAAWAPIEALVFGLNYTSRSRIQYNSILDYGKFSISDLYAGTGLSNFTVEEPQQISAGVKYEILTDLNVTFDWRWIGWHQSSGPRDLNWENQNVFALGAEEKYQHWHFRGGYNYAKAPLSNTAGETGTVFVQGTNRIDRSAQSIFDTAAFPAFVSSHYTLGAGYEFSDAWKADISFVYAPSASETRAGTTNLGSAYSFTATSSQFDVALGGSYSF